MTGPASQIDSAFAAALDRYDVPASSPTFAEAIVAAAVSGGHAPAPVSRASRRDRRGPWTRRAVAGGLALLLGTTAVTATLLERAGIRLPGMVAMLSPAPQAAPPPPPAVKQHRHVAKRAAVPPAPRTRTIEPVEATPTPEPAPLPQRAALIRERLASLPPPERRFVVRRAIRRAILARAIERRLASDDTDVSPARGADLAERPRLLDRPAIRAAIVEHTREERMATHAGVEPPAATRATPIDAPEIAPPAATAPAEADNAAVDGAPPQFRAERLRRFAELRRLRALRQELRQQRRR